MKGSRDVQRVGEMKSHLSTAFAMLMAGLFLAGCASPPPQNWRAADHSTPDLVMRLAAGDELAIRFFGAPDLDVVEKVRRDGKMNLRLVGEVQAAGKTPEELQQLLLARYADQLQINDISVQVVSQAPIYVGGSVLEPGRYVLDRPMTALELIMDAGGFRTPDAEVRSIVVLREGEGKRRGYILNLKPALEGKTIDSFYLQPYDVVFVPRTQITKLNEAVEQYINRMLPRVGIGYGTDGTVTFYR